MYIKKNARVTFRSNRRSNFKRNNNFSNGKTRNKGNVTQQYQKYLKLAKESSSSSDRIQSEYYYQFTDHYYRLMIELGINLDDADSQEIKSSDSTSIEGDSNNESVVSNASVEGKKNNDFTESLTENNQDDDDIESIGSVPFISEPVKKKTARTKKASA